MGTLESSTVLQSSPEFPKFNYFLLMGEEIQGCFHHEVVECISRGDGHAVASVGVGGNELFSGKKLISPGRQV